jgi:hypothetical protein
VLGSSLTLLGVDWQGIATELGRPVVTFGVPAASPAEIEGGLGEPAGGGRHRGRNQLV